MLSESLIAQENRLELEVDRIVGVHDGSAFVSLLGCRFPVQR